MKQYLVIGLGRFGTAVAETLYESNEEVLAIDIDEDVVQECINKNIVDNGITIDSTDIRNLKDIGAENYDIAFVCTGNIEPSIMITLNLKELGIKTIIAKAVSKSHGKVLSKIGATKVIYPEEYMGRRVAHLAMEPNLVEHLRFSADFLLLEVRAPSIFWGKSIIELDIRKNYNANVVGIKKADQSFNPSPLPSTVIEKDDILLIITNNKTAEYFENLK